MKFVQLDPNAVIPTRGSRYAAGYDLYANNKGMIEPNRRKTIPTGISWIEVPNHIVGLIMPRSGLAHKYGLDTMAGVIDSDYRGEINIILYNSGYETFSYNKGHRLAQLIIQEYLTLEEESIVYTRGNGGFGSTGS